MSDVWVICATHLARPSLTQCLKTYLGSRRALFALPVFEDPLKVLIAGVANSSTSTLEQSQLEEMANDKSSSQPCIAALVMAFANQALDAS